MSNIDTRGGRLRMPRSRGVAGGFLLVVLGLWGALAPFVGPYLNFALSPDQPWVWTAARGWLEVLPGVVTVVGGLMLIGSANRATAMLGGWLAALGGAWFVVGRAVGATLKIGDPGMPIAVTDAKRLAIELIYFSGLGALIVFLAAAALGRLSMRSAREVAFARATSVGPAVAPPDTASAAPARRRARGGLFGRRHTPAH